MAVGQLPEVIAAPYNAWVAPVGTSFPALTVAEGSFPSAWKKLGTSGANPDSALTNRRRIMRRGLPYGDPNAWDDTSEHGWADATLWCAGSLETPG